MMKNDVSMISALDWSFLVDRQSVSLSNGTKYLCKWRIECIHLKYVANFLPSLFRSCTAYFVESPQIPLCFLKSSPLKPTFYLVHYLAL
jgi:hypothetical protein